MEKEIPESWEGLETQENVSQAADTSTTDKVPPRDKASSHETVWTAKCSTPNAPTWIFADGHTAYVPQITKIMPRATNVDPKPSSIPSTDNTNNLSFEEKQRRYEEARKRIFTNTKQK